MNRSVVQLVRESIRRPGTFYLVCVVGTLINGYGQVLVPWLRDEDPWRELANHWSHEPWLFGTSLLLGYMFPLFVSTFSAVAAERRSGK
jgi:hypothetical protein